MWILFVPGSALFAGIPSILATTMGAGIHEYERKSEKSHKNLTIAQLS